MSLVPGFSPHRGLWIRSDETKLIETPIFALHSQTCISPTGVGGSRYFVLKTKEWVNVIPLTSDGEVVLVEQYRHGIHLNSLEFPGGIVEVAPLESAQRELQEETGYTSPEFEYLGKVAGNPAIFNNYSHTYLAHNAELTNATDWDDSEEIFLHKIKLKDLPELFASGVVTHSLMWCAFALLQLKHPEYFCSK